MKNLANQQMQSKPSILPKTTVILGLILVTLEIRHLYLEAAWMKSSILLLFLLSFFTYLTLVVAFIAFKRSKNHKDRIYSLLGIVAVIFVFIFDAIEVLIFPLFYFFSP